jgi:hypothetical protein
MGETRKGGFNWFHSSAGHLFGVSQIYGANEDHETVYMTRAWIGQLRFHIFHRGDQDPDCHDHPWDFWTFPLRSYVEEVLTPIRDTVAEGEIDPPQRYQRRLNVVKAFRFHFRKADYKHRVLGAYKRKIFTQDQTDFPPALIPTFVWRSDAYRKWGFVKERSGKWCWVAWKKYIYEGGKHGPCE